MEIKVIIPDEKKNDLTLKRMDNLEQKLDQQYRAFLDKSNDKSDYLKVIDRLQSSFMANFNKMLVMNKSMMTQAQNQKIDVLKKEFEVKIKSIEKDKDNDGELKLFTRKLDSLENAIKNITLKPQVVRVQNNNKTLFNSFNGILHRLEILIRESRPRLIPSPS